MADTDILISELTSATQINTDDLILLTQTDLGSETGYASRKGTALEVFNKALKGTQYSTDLPSFTNKTVLGGMEELKGELVSDLTDLGDVNISSPTNGQILKYDDVSGKWVNGNGGGGGASALTDLTDVTLTSPTSGQFLKYDGSKWVNDSSSAPWVDVTGTLTAGTTSVTLSNASITTSSTLDFFTDQFGVNPTNVSVSTGSVTLTFEAQASNVGVKVRIS